MTQQFSYITDKYGNQVAVQIPIEQWNELVTKNPDLDDHPEVPEWEKQMIRESVKFLKEHPDQVISGDDFMAKLDADAAE